jgi:hypothetical protein
MYKAREVFRNDVSLNASFGNRDALASMVAGAISAARMNITEYVTEENSYIQEWKQNITSAKNMFILERGIANSALVVGGIACGGLGPACIPWTIATQAVQWGLEYPTFKTSEEIDKLMHDEYNRADSYLTEKGKQVKELTKFLRTVVAMNETQKAPLVHLGGVLTSYVALTVASNATKTNADVGSDLDGILSGDDLDADVKTLAGMMFDDTPPPDVLDSFSYLRWVRILSSIGVILTSLILKWKINGVFKQHARYVAEFNNLGGVDIDVEFQLRYANKLLDERKALIHKLESKEPLTADEIYELGLYGNDKRLEKVSGDTMKYKFKKEAYRQEYLNVAREGYTNEVLSGVEEVTPLNKLENDVMKFKRVEKLKLLTEDRPTLDRIVEKKWYKNGAKGIIALTLASVAVDGIITKVEVDKINEFIDSAVSKQTSTLETTAGILKAWQELHTLT